MRSSTHAAPAGDRELLALLGARRAHLVAREGRRGDAKLLCQRALADTEDDRGRGELYLLLGTLQAETGDAEARASLLQAREFALRAGSAPLSGRALLALGALAVQTGELDRARVHFTDAAVALGDGDQRGAAIAVFGLGVVADAAGATRDAVARFEHALASFREAGERIGEAQALHALVAPLRAAGDYVGAEAAAAESRTRLAELGERPRDAADALAALALSLPG